MTRVRKDNRLCEKVRGCQRALYADGCCEPHYRRVRLYGHPLATRPVGGPKLIPAELDAALTRRQREEWTRLGYLLPEKTPTGRYQWTASEIRIAQLMVRLNAAGLPLSTAAGIARSTVDGRRRVHALAEGLALRVDL